jgi:hypothetical protein
VDPGDPTISSESSRILTCTPGYGRPTEPGWASSVIRVEVMAAADSEMP